MHRQHKQQQETCSPFDLRSVIIRRKTFPRCRTPSPQNLTERPPQSQSAPRITATEGTPTVRPRPCSTPIIWDLTPTKPTKRKNDTWDRPEAKKRSVINLSNVGSDGRRTPTLLTPITCDLPPRTSCYKPTRHPNTNRKNETWRLPEARKRTLIVGDSNLSNVPPFTQVRVTTLTPELRC